MIPEKSEDFFLSEINIKLHAVEKETKECGGNEELMVLTASTAAISIVNKLDYLINASTITLLIVGFINILWFSH